VQILPEPPASASAFASCCSLSPQSPAQRNAQRIEIALADGTVIHVGEGIGTTALRRVLSARRR
jgi:hypothetical protein